MNPQAPGARGVAEEGEIRDRHDSDTVNSSSGGGGGVASAATPVRLHLDWAMLSRRAALSAAAGAAGAPSGCGSASNQLDGDAPSGGAGNSSAGSGSARSGGASSRSGASGGATGGTGSDLVVDEGGAWSSGSRSRDANSSGRGSGNLIFLDSGSLRRGSLSTLASSALEAASRVEAVAAAAVTSGGGASAGGSYAAAQLDMVPSTALTADLLARTYGILMRQIGELLRTAYKYQKEAPLLPRILAVTKEEVAELQEYVERQMQPTWDWLFTIMDSVEAKLRFGSVFASSTDPAHPSHSYNPQSTNFLGIPLPVGPNPQQQLRSLHNRPRRHWIREEWFQGL